MATGASLTQNLESRGTEPLKLSLIVGTLRHVVWGHTMKTHTWELTTANESSTESEMKNMALV